MNVSAGFWNLVSNSVYGALALDALWGAYCIAVVFLRVAQQRFRSEEEQQQYLDGVEEALARRDFDGVIVRGEQERRALPRLTALACLERHMPIHQLTDLLVERFERDVIGDLEHRVSWTNNVIKTAPMLGLLGTVLGMMAAFSKLAASESVQPDQLASDISFALITTAIGLAIAIPATVCVASLNIRIRQLEQQVEGGLVRLFAILEPVVGPRGSRSG
jgi:biopolymer transport protein ExbB/TolQ